MGNAIGRVALRIATKNLKFVLAQDVLMLAWASGRVLISIPGNQKAIDWNIQAIHLVINLQLD